ncbi:hypothetical protein HAPAU_26850 [Halalkalicoccus paucihalophilus]|uniref:Uncharacterized protein n=1 Tax=Halalkalicoccus paucihalophilus TaxID=1008153 RepID=A0A151AC71_9EURY|nr:hypothetical protein [Halalkalicoccus paucihalophilus]KYH25102.1 hypothetical protein HAPAU_26850 [Halalkalicoccus paucihalophilus]
MYSSVLIVKSGRIEPRSQRLLLKLSGRGFRNGPDFLDFVGDPPHGLIEGLLEMGSEGTRIAIAACVGDDTG